MTQTDNFHSQLVGWAKIILPLCALALLSTLFLFARDGNNLVDDALAQAEEIAREQKVTAPEFSGVAADGTVIVVSAKSAQPDSTRPDTVQAEEMRLRLDTSDGNFVEVTAVLGEVDGGQRIARFLGLARLQASNGFEMETNGLFAELDTGRVVSEGLLEIRAPFGALTAGKVIFQTRSSGIGQEILFTNGVRLLYTPPKP